MSEAKPKKVYHCGGLGCPRTAEVGSAELLTLWRKEGEVWGPLDQRIWVVRYYCWSCG